MDEAAASSGTGSLTEKENETEMRGGEDRSGKGRNGRRGAHLQVVLVGGGSSGGTAELAGERGEAEEIPWCLRRPRVEASKGKELLAWGSEDERAAGRKAVGAGLLLAGGSVKQRTMDGGLGASLGRFGQRMEQLRRWRSG